MWQTKSSKCNEKSDGYILIIFADIAIAVVDLMQELTDVDTLNESEENATALIDAMVSVSDKFHSVSTVIWETLIKS